MTPSPHPRSEDTRGAILRAAIAEFAERGEIGARTDAIARAAGVNKALLHYHFGSKGALYQACLDEILSGLKERYLTLLEGPGTPGQRMLRYFLAHFDRMAYSQNYSRVVGHEMMRARAGESTSIPRMTRAYFMPLHEAACRVLEAGVREGEFQDLDPSHTLLSLTGANLFYFMTAPVFQEITGRDPREPELLARRRPAFLHFAASALFADREAGRRAAEAVLLETPSTLPHP